MNAPPPASGSGEEIDLLQQQRWSMHQEQLIEDELKERIGIARAQHDAYLLTAERYMKLLFRSAESSAAAVEALALTVDQGRDSADSRGISASLEGTSMNGARLGRVVCHSVNKGAGIRVLNRVEVDGDALRRKTAVATRHVNLEGESMKEALRRFEFNEDRRRQSFLRRAAILMSRSKGMTALSQGADRATSLMLTEGHRRQQREAIREKQERLAESFRAAELKRQAIASAHRQLNYTASRQVLEAREHLLNEARTAALRAHQLSLKTDHFRNIVDREASYLHQRRQRARKDFSDTITAESRRLVTEVRKREHEDNARHAKAADCALAIEAVFPAPGVVVSGQSQSRSDRRSIDRESYARLCGFKHEFTLGGTDVSVADIAVHRHVPPKAWDILHAVDATAALLTMRDAQAHVLGGPSAVRWA